MNILSVGTVAFDAIETPFGKTDKILGGAGTFIGLSASLLGAKIDLVSVIGGDFPQEYLDLLIQKGIGIEGIEIVKEGKTFFWSGKYHNDMNSRDTLITELNVLADFQPKVPQESKNADILLLGNLSPEVQMSVINQMETKPQLTILDTMNFWMDIALDQLIKVIAKVDVITINDSEARQLSGEYSLVKAAKKIHQMGPEYVIIKKGEHGALLFHNDEIFSAPALPLEEVFDPTGAGDTFAGGFAGYLARTKDLSFENMKNAIIVGSALASFCVEKFGTERIQNVSENELSQRISKFQALTSYSIKL